MTKLPQTTWHGQRRLISKLKINGIAKAVLNAIHGYLGKNVRAWLSYSRLSSLTGFARSTVVKWTAWLLDNQLISKIKRWDPQVGTWRVNHYEINWAEVGGQVIPHQPIVESKYPKCIETGGGHDIDQGGHGVDDDQETRSAITSSEREVSQQTEHRQGIAHCTDNQQPDSPPSCSGSPASSEALDLVPMATVPRPWVEYEQLGLQVDPECASRLSEYQPAVHQQQIQRCRDFLKNGPIRNWKTFLFGHKGLPAAEKEIISAQQSSDAAAKAAAARIEETQLANQRLLAIPPDPNRLNRLMEIRKLLDKR